MAISTIYTDTGRVDLDDVARTATTYDENGTQLSIRAFNESENANADKAVLTAMENANQDSIEAALEASLLTLQTIIDDTNANINANPAARIKDLARVNRRLIRLVIRRFDGTT